MGTFFDQFSAVENNRRPPNAVRLVSRLRTHADTERVRLVYELDPRNDVWFENAPGNPGILKSIEYHGVANSSGVEVPIESGLLCGPNDQVRTAVIRATVFRPGDGKPMHVARDEIFIR